MDNERTKNSNVARSLEYVIFYVKANGARAKTTCKAAKLEKVQTDLTKIGCTILDYTPKTDLKK